MRITKLEHAALVLEEAGQKLVVDPGAFSRPLPDASSVAAVVITHEHGDHWDAAHLNAVLEANPDAPIYGPAGVATAAGAEGFDVTVVENGDEVTAGAFTLKFFGADHAVIHESIPIVDNVGVLVNDTLYYPGDSFTIPEGVEVDVLATPSSAPWLKVGETLDFVLAVKPKRAFSTHEMINSDLGKGMADDRIAWAAAENGGTFIALNPGDSAEL